MEIGLALRQVFSCLSKSKVLLIVDDKYLCLIDDQLLLKEFNLKHFATRRSDAKG
jgi:hypothetical protein